MQGFRSSFRSMRVPARGAFACLALAAASLSQAALPLRGVSAVSAGGAHTCALTTTGGVLCWGDGSAGQLGDGMRSARATPVGVFGLSSGATAVSAGSEHTCALTTGGAAKCWGLDYDGQLGDGSGAFGVIRDTPVDVAGLSHGVAVIAAGASHTCAVTTAGGVKCWGSNDHGQLGDGTMTRRLAPVDVSALSAGVVAVALGDYHTCALMASGSAKCWGDNDNGQLGDGTPVARLTPVSVSGLAGATAITAGDFHACALASGGIVCWGDNGNGQLGNGTTTPSSVPVGVSGLGGGVAAISAGSDFDQSCALLVGGNVRCWGEYYFPIGGIFPVASTTPLDRGFAGAVAISAGGAGFVLTSHVCAVGTDGGVRCQGGNHYGQLGNGAPGGYSDTAVEVVLSDAIFADGFD
jgi:alpha-tubulin suppressor-like RCC1 family protein